MPDTLLTGVARTPCNVSGWGWLCDPAPGGPPGAWQFCDPGYVCVYGGWSSTNAGSVIAAYWDYGDYVLPYDLDWDVYVVLNNQTGGADAYYGWNGVANEDYGYLYGVDVGEAYPFGDNHVYVGLGFY